MGRKRINNGKYIDDQMGNGVPSGGAIGQVLVKNSATDYDYGWGSGIGQIHLTSDFTTSNTAAQNTNLTFAIAADEIYAVTVTGTVSKATSSTGLKLAVGAPTGCTIKGFQTSGQAAASTAMQNSILSSINSLGATFATGTGVEVPFVMQFVVKNGSTAGNITIQMATVTSNVATMYAYTKMTYIKSTAV